MFEDLVKKNRSYRRFYQDEKISEEILTYLINLARLTPSAANVQPLKYIVSNNDKVCTSIFNCLGWAGYLKDWSGPLEGERPSAYIVILNDISISKSVMCDQGITAQTILLGAVEKGFGGCMLASFAKDKLIKSINIPKGLEPILVIALGKPKETVRIQEIELQESIKYFRDEDDVHIVPKRKLEDVIITI